MSCVELEGIERESENERNWRERRGRVGRDLREKVFGMKENKKAGERKESRKRGKEGIFSFGYRCGGNTADF